MPTLQQILDDSAADPALAAARLRHPDLAAGLLAALAAAPPATRPLLCDAVGWHRPAGATAALVAHLADGAPAVRLAAVRALAAVADPAAGPALAAAFAAPDPDLSVRRALLVALGAVGHRAAIPTLMEWLDNPDDVQRALAAEALAALGAEEAVPALAEAIARERLAATRGRLTAALDGLRRWQEGDLAVRSVRPDPAPAAPPPELAAELAARPPRLAGHDLRHQVLPADLAGADLAAAVLCDAALDGADLRAASLCRAALDRARLAGARLAGADLTGASLVDARASGAQLAGARARSADLSRADLARADLAAVELAGARLERADLRGADLRGADLRGADLRRANLAGARLGGAVVDRATRWGGAAVSGAVGDGLVVDGRRLNGPEAAAFLAGRAARRSWRRRDLELYLLAKMSAAAHVSRALATLGASRDEMAAIGGELAQVLDEPGAAAAEYARILGAPAVATRLGADAGAFAGSLRREYPLRLWPGVRFVVHEHPDGYAWGWGFTQAPRPLPADLATVEPWQWTASALRAAATREVVLEQWSFDLEVELVFAAGDGEQHFRARFDLDLLQSWRAA
jgi:uncharacterized protein YjbI with pentapeptide repeats